ncbi:hypothetical protein llap_5244 [Limosa lapponica baueri]|uniref:Uncharacterized protein n=1 Tax=Limosa lapponica baueri TaxID=1758121 RepID=A0A2I0UEI3_LIMLA|nr:hypothetical protein llap_5244 [Limosa lapponica baueri]
MAADGAERQKRQPGKERAESVILSQQEGRFEGRKEEIQIVEEVEAPGRALQLQPGPSIPHPSHRPKVHQSQQFIHIK